MRRKICRICKQTCRTLPSTRERLVGLINQVLDLRRFCNGRRCESRFVGGRRLGLRKCMSAGRRVTKRAEQPTPTDNNANGLFHSCQPFSLSKNQRSQSRRDLVLPSAQFTTESASRGRSDSALPGSKEQGTEHAICSTGPTLNHRCYRPTIPQNDRSLICLGFSSRPYRCPVNLL